MASRTPNQVSQLYEKVIQDVITNVRDSFLDDGVDEQVLTELKQIWETKLSQTKAVDSPTIGDRVRPTYSYTAMTAPKAPVLYQVPTAAVHLSAASQQARAGVPSIIYQRSGNIVLPTTNKMFSSYQPVTSLRQPGTQQVALGADTIVLASSQNVPQQSSNKPGSSNVVQLDGPSDVPSEPENGKVSDICKYESSGAWKKIIPKRKLQRKVLLQVDGKGDSSSSDDDLGDDDDDEDDDDDDADDDETEESQEKDAEDEEPLNSNDDDSDDDDAGELFDVENVVVCQYDKIHRAKAKWKFNLKVGIMNLEGKDHVFLKANGEADW